MGFQQNYKLIFLSVLLAAVTFHFGEAKSLISTDSQIYCSSSSMTLTQLKAASSLSCPENDEAEFWEAACLCTLKELPKSQCPVCRLSRKGEQYPGSSGKAASAQQRNPRPWNAPAARSDYETASPEAIDGIRNTSILNDSGDNGMAKMSSQNFIRFG